MSGDTSKRWKNRYWGDLDPRPKVEFFDAVTTPAPAGDGTVATIRMYGPIDSWGGWWGISTADVGGVIDALPDTVTQIVLRINSPGGEVFEGVSILNMLRAHKAKVTAVVDGLAASAASVIAAGCDETVMSPGTQMMIHSPWTFTWGNADDLRKSAKVLDSIESSLVEIYTGKAGMKDWAALLAEETWMTAAETVELGLADRVAVVPDAGDSATIGADDPEPVLIPDDEDDVEDSVPGRFSRLAAAASAAPQTPSSSEPGTPNRKENAVSYSDLQAGLRDRLGVTDADASDETLLQALDQALEESADAPILTAVAEVAELPEGVVMMDAAQLEQLRSDAAAGREARAQQESDRRDGIVQAAFDEGRIAASSRDRYRALLDVDEKQTTELLNSLAKNTVPVAELGHQDSEATSDDALYARAWGNDDKKGA